MRSLKEMERYAVSAVDGDMGVVVDFLLDDEHWAVRYLVAEIGVCDYYGRPVYWDAPDRPLEAPPPRHHSAGRSG